MTYARDRREKGMGNKLANEIMDAMNQQGGAFKRKDDVYRMAQANKALDRKSTRLNSSHIQKSRMPSSA